MFLCGALEASLVYEMYTDMRERCMGYTIKLGMTWIAPTAKVYPNRQSNGYSCEQDTNYCDNCIRRN
jgi:hypothetical protein